MSVRGFVLNREGNNVNGHNLASRTNLDPAWILFLIVH